MKIKWKTKAGMVPAILLVGAVICLAGCSKSDDASAGAAQVAAFAKNAPAADTQRMVMMKAATPAAPTGGVNVAFDTSRQAQSQEAQPQIPQRQVIRKADLDVRVENVEKAERAADAVVSAAGGYVESAASTDLASTHPVMKLAVRVPVSAFDSSIAKFEALGVRLSKTISSDDVTNQLVDLDARLKTLHAKEDVFRNMLKNRSQLDDVFNIQNQLTEVRTQIESIAGQRKAQAGLASLSTIGLTLEQNAIANVATTDPNWMAQTWAEASSGASVAFRIFVVAMAWLVAFSPFWIPLLLILRKVARQGVESKLAGHG